MNENKMPYGKVYANHRMTTSLPINTAFLTADMLELVENTVDFWLEKCKAESRYGTYQGTETILTIDTDDDGKKWFTLEVIGHFPDMLLNENIDVLVTPEIEDFYYKKMFEQITENFATFGKIAE